ncbi:MAG TPA: hypothetical protein VGX03_34360 [Candidatus Binatia bacterium]|jgi:hypothetical protein|nr:hypothetical protein [Candidatus Binatia bacterium]
MTKREVFDLIQKKAAALVSKSAVPLTAAQAIDEVVQQNPDLYEMYRTVPEGAPEPEPTKTETVKAYAARFLLERAEEIQKARRLDRAEAISQAVKEYPAVYSVAQNPKFATVTVDEIRPAVQKSTPVKSEVSKVVPIYKRFPGRPFTFNQIRALERGESPDAA